MTTEVSGLRLTENEERALDLLISAGGSLLTSSIPDSSERDIVFGLVTPGHSVYRRLERLGLVFYTVEDPLDCPGDPLDGFLFTNEVYISDEGRAARMAAQQLQRLIPGASDGSR